MEGINPQLAAIGHGLFCAGRPQSIELGLAWPDHRQAFYLNLQDTLPY